MSAREWGTEGRPLLVSGPKDSLVVRNRPATLTCRALYASRVRFRCNGEWLRPEDHVLKEGLDPESGLPYVEASVPIHRKQVEGYFGLDGFSCQCLASASAAAGKGPPDQVQSDHASVRVACESPLPSPPRRATQTRQDAQHHLAAAPRWEP